MVDLDHAAALGRLAVPADELGFGLLPLLPNQAGLVVVLLGDAGGLPLPELGVPGVVVSAEVDMLDNLEMKIRLRPNSVQ